MKSSPLRRWLREERGRGNAEALAAGMDIAPTRGPIVSVDWARSDQARHDALALLRCRCVLTPLDDDEAFGQPWPPLRPGHKLIDTGLATPADRREIATDDQSGT